MSMKTIETTGRILKDGSIELDRPVNGPAGNVRMVILYADDLSEDFLQNYYLKRKTGL